MTALQWHIQFIQGVQTRIEISFCTIFAPSGCLTRPGNSRRLRVCEGCGLSRPFPRMTFPEVRTTPRIQALEMEAKLWQTTYRR